MKTRSMAAIAFGLAAASLAAMPLSASAQENTTNFNYVGAGVGIGTLGTGDFGLSVNSKVTVADNVSVRPGLITDLNFSNSGETLVLLPVTYDFNSITRDGRLLPFAGAGLSVSTEGAWAAAPLLTAGVDYRITDRVVANGTVNWSIFGNSRVNGTVGLGYTF